MLLDLQKIYFGIQNSLKVSSIITSHSEYIIELTLREFYTSASARMRDMPRSEADVAQSIGKAVLEDDPAGVWGCAGGCGGVWDAGGCGCGCGGGLWVVGVGVDAGVGVGVVMCVCAYVCLYHDVCWCMHILTYII